jgi:hypothetical protein
MKAWTVADRTQPVGMHWSLAVCTAFLVAAATSTVAARDEAQQSLPPNATYVQECGSCHLPFPPHMLPAESWQRLMAGMSKHFGSDASIDAASQAALSAWLVAHAGNDRRFGQVPPDDRLTRSNWFVRKHRDVGSRVWKRASVGSPTHCAACHTGATQGDFDEDRVRIPK